MSVPERSTASPATGLRAQPQPQTIDPSIQTPTSSDSGSAEATKQKPRGWRKAWDRFYRIVSWTPPRCRWDSENPPKFTLGLNVLFAFAGAFTVANLYYNHPILNILADDFHVPYEKVSEIPTVMQAGYACGLLFICPLGDLLRRRAFVICLMAFTAAMWVGLCITNNLAVFTGISFICAVTTVTPQLMLPLVGDLAPPHRRAAALSVVVSGFSFGILLARVLSGIVAEYANWRVIYWIALGTQSTMTFLLWLFMPDYPATNKNLNYFKMLWSILVLVVKYPVLVQAMIISFCTSATFTSFWTTLTFLLAGSPYNYSSLVIGLFALIGITSMCFSPLYARLVTDKFVPIFSVLVGESMCLIGIVIGTYIGNFSVAGPVIQAFLLDWGMLTAQIANRSSIYAIEPKSRNRVNTAFMLGTFCGQLTGTAVGNHLYARGGWIASGSCSVGFIAFAILVCFLRGPYEQGWVGWRGGWNLRKKNIMSADGQTAEKVVYGKRSAGDAETAEEKVTEELAGEEGENPLREIRDEEEKRATLDSEK